MVATPPAPEKTRGQDQVRVAGSLGHELIHDGYNSILPNISLILLLLASSGSGEPPALINAFTGLSVLLTIFSSTTSACA